MKIWSEYQKTFPNLLFLQKIVCTKATEIGRIILKEEKMMVTEVEYKIKIPVEIEEIFSNYSKKYLRKQMK